ncbi:hypothetical protein ACFQFG_21625 [Methylobacterium persicinum]
MIEHACEEDRVLGTGTDRIQIKASRGEKGKKSVFIPHDPQQNIEGEAFRGVIRLMRFAIRQHVTLKTDAMGLMGP